MPTEPPATELRRSLTLMDATMINVGTMLGSGIFITPAGIARDLHHPLLHMAVWIGGGLFAVLGALAIAELGSMMPRAGGLYIYLEKAFGPVWGFLYGWALFLAIQCGGIAAVAVGTATYVGYFVPLGTAGLRAVAIASILLLTWINTRGVAQGALVQNVLTLIKIGAVLVLVALAISAGDPSRLAAGPDPAGASAPFSWAALGVAMVAAMWCYDGWIHISYVGGELRDPARTLPRAALLSTTMVIGIYLALNLAYMMVLGIGGIAAAPDDRVASQTALAVIGSAGGGLVAALVALSTLGANNGFILAGARIYYAMARDGLFFRRVARVDPDTAVPAASLWLQAGWSSLLVFTGSYDQIFTYVIFVEFLFFGLAALAVVRLRSIAPTAPRPYRTWGYPWTNVLFALFSAGLLVSTIASAPRAAAIGAAVMASGIPAYHYWHRRRSGSVLS